MIELIILSISMIVFFYVLHYFVQDDFVILRKNVPIDQIFNMVFLSFIFSFIFSRLLFALQNPSPLYLNPLAFLAFPYYPGFSLTGGLIGGVIFSIWFVRRKKFPAKRIFDFLSLSVAWSIPVYSFLSLIIFRNFQLEIIVEAVLFTLLLIVLAVFLMPKYLAGKIKDGFITGVFCIGISLVSTLTNFLGDFKTPGIILEDLLLITIFIAGLFLIIKEQLMPKIKDLK